ncbi:hypothetical protein GGX14DRAFT_403439 [Mycena pura]|uniref:Uncharacterized protein n=1 Tax=Mycena pura TaxID=153505 RepID=A0AAD6UWN1_9AGAR|nr:hypothetical protein GGX14DRAFT_403439 [Mycena pura]
MSLSSKSTSKGSLENPFDTYLKTCTPDIPNPVSSEATAEALKKYEEELVHLFLILVKRSIFLPSTDDEKEAINTILDLIDCLHGEQRVYYSVFRKFAASACKGRWEDPERMEQLFSKYLDGRRISVFGSREQDADAEESDGSSDEDDEDKGTDDESVAKKIDQLLPPFTDSSDRPHIPNFRDDGVLDGYFNEVQDKFFELTAAAELEDLTVNQTRELMFYYTMLRLVDHSALNHREYKTLYNNCHSKTHSLQATNLNKSYQPSAERGHDSTKNTLHRTAYGEFCHWTHLSNDERADYKDLQSNAARPADVFTSEDEDETKIANKKTLPTLPKFPKGLSKAHLYNFQQEEEPNARSVLTRAKHRLQAWSRLDQLVHAPGPGYTWELLPNQQGDLDSSSDECQCMAAQCRSITGREVGYLQKLLTLLEGHPVHNRISHLLMKAKKSKLNPADLLELRAMAGNSESAENEDDMDKDAEMQDVEVTDESLSLLHSIISDLGAQAENCGVVLEMIQKQAKEGIMIYHLPLYHTSASASKNPRTPAVYAAQFGNLSRFLRHPPATFLQNSSDSVDIRLALLLTPLENTKGVSHVDQLNKPTHTVVVGIVHLCNPKSRALLIWDANILFTERHKSKESLHPSTQAVIKRARENERCPKFDTFWINEGQRRNHNNVCLKLTLEEILRIACNGLKIRRGEAGQIEKVEGFVRVDDN